jgi:hypothetical protein
LKLHDRQALPASAVRQESNSPVFAARAVYAKSKVMMVEDLKSIVGIGVRSRLVYVR